MQVILVYLLGGFEYFWHCTILQMIDCRGVYPPRQCQEEWDFVHEKDIACEDEFIVHCLPILKGSSLDKRPLHSAFYKCS